MPCQTIYKFSDNICSIRSLVALQFPTLTSRLSLNNEVPVVGRPTAAVEEQLIADRAIRRALICFPVTKRELLIETIRVVYNEVERTKKFKDNLPSKLWYYRFQNRHKLTLRKSEDLDSERNRVSNFR